MTESLPPIQPPDPQGGLPPDAEDPLPLEYRAPSSEADETQSYELPRWMNSFGCHAVGLFVLGCVYAVGSAIFGFVVLWAFSHPGPDPALPWIFGVLIALLWVVPLVATVRRREGRFFALGLLIMAGFILATVGQCFMSPSPFRGA